MKDYIELQLRDKYDDYLNKFMGEIFDMEMTDEEDESENENENEIIKE